MKKVLFLINTLRGGGAEKVLVDTVNHLDKEKYQITVQTIFDEGVFRENLSPYVRYKTVVKTKNRFFRKIWSKLISSVCSPKLVYRFFIRDRYDYEIAFLEGLPTKILSESTNREAVKIAWVHSDLLDFPDSYRYFGSEKCEAEAYNCFDKVICVSDAVKKSFLKKYSNVKTQVRVLYNILDDQTILQASKEDTLVPWEVRPCFISVGRLTRQKGFDRLLRVHCRLMEKGLLHSLVIIGEGELRGQLETFVKDNNLCDSVFFLGFQTNPHKYVSKADCFVCSSYSEGFSTVVSESVLCGTPVISTDVAGSREPVAAPRCSLVVENSEEALYNAMCCILNNPKILYEYRKNLNEKQECLRTANLIEMFETEVFA